MIQDSINGNAFENPRDSRIRNANHPMNLNYTDPDDAVAQISSCDNANPVPWSADVEW